jgi:hypothetical protein
VHGLPGLYRLVANRNKSCPTRGTQKCGGNFFWLGEVYPYYVEEDEEFAMDELIPSPGDDAGGEAAEYCRTERFVAVALRKIICYLEVSL